MKHTSLFRRLAPALCASAVSAMLLACGGPSPQDSDGMMNCHDSCYREFRKK